MYRPPSAREAFALGLRIVHLVASRPRPILHVLYQREQTMTFQWQREVSEQCPLNGRREHRRLFRSLMKDHQRATANQRNTKDESRCRGGEITLDDSDQRCARAGAFLRFLEA